MQVYMYYSKTQNICLPLGRALFFLDNTPRGVSVAVCVSCNALEPPVTMNSSDSGMDSRSISLTADLLPRFSFIASRLPLSGAATGRA